VFDGAEVLLGYETFATRLMTLVKKVGTTVRA